MSSVVYGIERDTIVSRDIKVGRGKASRVVTKMYWVLSFFDEMYNKWFMTPELPKLWIKVMKVEENKKYKVWICMVIDGVFENFDDIALDWKHFQPYEIHTCVLGNEIVDGHGKYVPYSM